MSEEMVERISDKLHSCACLLDAVAEDAKARGDIVTWAMASVMAEDAHDLLATPSAQADGGV